MTPAANPLRLAWRAGIRLRVVGDTLEADVPDTDEARAVVAELRARRGEVLEALRLVATYDCLSGDEHERLCGEAAAGDPIAGHIVSLAQEPRP